MHGAQENMVRAGYADDSGAKQWAHSKVEALFHLRLRELIVLAIGIRGVGDIRDWQPHGEAVSDKPYQVPPLKSENGAQAGMAIRQLLPAGLEGAPGEGAAHP